MRGMSVLGIAEILEQEDVGKLYGARWDIELMFKELKSRYALDVWVYDVLSVVMSSFISSKHLTLIFSSISSPVTSAN